MSIAVTNSQILDRIKGELESRVLEERQPFLIEVAKSIVPEFISYISANFFLYKPVADKGDIVVFALSLPENYLKHDEKIMDYSAHLLDMEILKELVKRGKYIESGIVDSPRVLIKYLKHWSLVGRKLVLLTSTQLPVKGAVLFVNHKVKASWVDAVDVHLGMKAIRVLLYYGPYKYIVFEI